MSILVFGKDGQVGKALQIQLAGQNDVIFLGREECDLANTQNLKKTIEHHNPHIIINASAYTAVDKAQTEKELAFKINEKVPRIMAEHIAQVSGTLIHYSTDYVFDDTKSVPESYLETDPAGPIESLGIYGQSKLAGEEAIQKICQKNPSANFYILRTSWVYGDGNNFIKTMLRLATEREQLKVVCDQWGVPTSAHWLAHLALLFFRNPATSGIYHAVPHGRTNWYELAVFAIEAAKRFGQSFQLETKNIVAIPATEYPLTAPRPYNSLLNNNKLERFMASLPYPQIIPHWDEEVLQYVEHLVSSVKQQK
ncbi:dTDP-4-dehydrorhamnose reductase [Polynucleobacter sp. MWH-Loch1C5]|uniref:dTDP-4-dehydrorhamnose reductase n=1 Tax=Polynucleobacter sp. MWH-Loch1C5 TaxID=2689108 RepID=UPI001C0BD5C3|nr:dTDP-4-dehydrorhamnose reductase [Polynucleobacter sp. MWH-Loch1C5]MBU3542198.1 dTDP-4-dehydrorhamnose reductase [Polynucleobacter sp. MWH-Loch1C5]